MKTFSKKSCRTRLTLLAAFAWSGVLFAQSAQISSSTSESPDIFVQYQHGQWALSEQSQALISERATQAVLDVWMMQNAPLFAVQQQLAQALAMASALEPIQAAASVNIPPGASGTLTDFLTTQASLGYAFAFIHNQFLQTMPANPTQEQVDWMQQQEVQTFQQQNAGDLELQAERAQSLGAAAEAMPIPVPGPPVFPPNASPQLQAFLTAQNTLAAAQAQLWNQYLTADPGVRDFAMLQYHMGSHLNIPHSFFN